MLRPVNQRRSPYQVFSSVVFALWFRDVRMRVADTRLGWMWTLAAPAVGVVIFSAMAGIRGRGQFLFGVEYPVYLLTGMVPYGLWVSLFASGLGALSKGSGLFIYRQVRPFDVLVANALQITMVRIMALALLCLLAAWLGFHIMPYDLLGVLTILLLMITFGFGLSLLGAVGALLLPALKRALPFILRPMMFLSGVIVPLSTLPSNLRNVFLCNPLLHMLELLRACWFPGFVPAPGITWTMVWMPAMTALGLGLMAYWHFRKRLSEES